MEEIIVFFENLLQSHNTAWLIGQVLGIVAIILGFVSFQMKTQKGLLFMQVCVAAVFCVHYFLIEAYSGMAMNAVCIVRNLVYDHQNQKAAKNKLIPIIFVVIQCVMCALTWDAWYSVFVLVGIAINTYCMSFSDPQNVRKSIFFSCPLVLIYNIFASSIGGIIYESVAIASAFIGVIKNRKKVKASDKEAS